MIMILHGYVSAPTYLAFMKNDTGLAKGDQGGGGTNHPVWYIKWLS